MKTNRLLLAILSFGIACTAHTHTMVTKALEAGPMLGPELELDPQRPTAAAQRKASVAFNGEVYLVLWEDSRNNGTGWDLYGVRIRDADEGLLDAVPLAICTARGDQTYPAVASDGQNFLVVWEDARGTSSDIYGARVRASDGAVLDASGLPIRTLANNQRAPSVTSNGSTYLVVWQENSGGQFDFTDLYGTRLNPADGSLLDAPALTVSMSSMDQRFPTAASNGRDYLVVWEDDRDSTSYSFPGGVTFDIRTGVYATMLDGLTGQVAPSLLLEKGSRNIAAVTPASTSVGADWIAVWTRTGHGAVVGGAMLGTTNDAPVITTEFRPSWAGYDAAVASNGKSSLAVWQNNSAAGLQVLGQIVDGMGNVSSDLPLAIAAGSSPAVACNGGSRFLVVYGSGAEPPEASVRAKWVRLTGPAITSQPVDQTVLEGASATLSVAAVGVMPLSYQWRKDGVDIPGATATDYSIQAAHFADAGAYTVMVANPYGSQASSAAILQVAPVPPLFLNQPQSQNVFEGVSVLFSVTVAGTNPVTYQWHKDGVAIAGATQASYRLENVKLDDAGEYRVEASNRAGSLLSAGATLRITELVPPLITVQPQSQSVRPGSRVTFSVLATGSEPLTYQWYRDGVSLPGATDPTLVLASAQVGNAGTYNVVVNNEGGSASSDGATLSVTAQPLPTITLEPSGQTVALGSRFTFTVRASGAGPLGYQWYRDGAILPGKTLASLVLSSVQAGDAGIYRVLVSNAEGSVWSSEAVLWVGDYIFITLAGRAGSSGSMDGLGDRSRFNFPEGIAVDSADNVYVADTGNHTVRKIAPGGMVTTLAGQAGAYGSSGGLGSSARFNQPARLAVDASGNVYVADRQNFMIRKITSGGLVSTLAGRGGLMGGSKDGTGAAAEFRLPNDVALDAGGNVYVADTANHLIRRISPAARVTTLAGNASIMDQYGIPVGGYSDGSGKEARFHWPNGVATDSAGNVYVADSRNYTIRRITPDGIVSTVAGQAGVTGGTDGVGNQARFFFPRGVATDAFGNVFVADEGTGIRKISADGRVSTLNGAGSPYGVAVDASGSLYVADRSNHTIKKRVWTLLGGTHPEIRLFDVRISETQLLFRWRAQAGQFYRVQVKSTLLETNWSDLAPSITTTGDTASFSAPLTGAPQRFYRVRPEP